MRARLLAVVMAVLPCLPFGAAAQDEDTYGEPSRGGQLSVTGWGGTLLELQGNRPSVSHFGGEVAYSFSVIDVGILAEAYHLDPTRSAREWTPVLLARLEERFETRRGLDAVLALGLGAAHTGLGGGWRSWYQFAIGMRLALGPMFLAGEVGFEQLDLFRLAAGLGVRF